AARPESLFIEVTYFCRPPRLVVPRGHGTVADPQIQFRRQDWEVPNSATKSFTGTSWRPYLVTLVGQLNRPTAMVVAPSRGGSGRCRRRARRRWRPPQAVVDDLVVVEEGGSGPH